MQNAGPGIEKSGRSGVTLIELLVVIAIISVLASAVLPLSQVTVRRVKEIELRENLRLLRRGIDEFKADCDNKKLSTVEGYCKTEQNNYPATLEMLTEPLKLSGAVDKTRKYLRRIPRDAMTPVESPDKPNNWGLRSYSDPPDSTQWGGDNVFDVYSKSDKIGLDGTKYSTW
ncbi:MAG TPA: prepilin-type N-terminal cleavage/methylation domain-containing protein [Nitrospirota bacterium]|nr:prepilin-type N-terminal cleavage/methylation domain-containing protein [Nitrospirota bacterium]